MLHGRGVRLMRPRVWTITCTLVDLALISPPTYTQLRDTQATRGAARCFLSYTLLRFRDEALHGHRRATVKLSISHAVNTGVFGKIELVAVRLPESE